MSRSIPRGVLLPILLAGALSPFPAGLAAQAAGVAAAADDVAPRCRAPEYRQFDFWLGEWEVRNAAGDVVGHNEVRRVAGGCGLLESWRGTGGGSGTSLNTYDAERGHWTQRWVGDGTTLWLVGGLDGGRMVLSGTSPRTTPRGAVLDRISWSALPDGRVRQLWEISPDGENWSVGFDGYYSRIGPAPTPRR